MKPITHFKDIDGLPIHINPAQVFAVRRMVKKSKNGNGIVEVISSNGASVSVEEMEDANFMNFFREAFEGTT